MLRIAARFGASNVRVFGSVSRGENHEGSDLDILVEVARGTTLFQMARMQRMIEEELGVRVDVRTEADFPEKLRRRVLADAVPV